jgi:hypothetical protein
VVGERELQDKRWVVYLRGGCSCGGDWMRRSRIDLVRVEVVSEVLRQEHILGQRQLKYTRGGRRLI